MRVRLDSRLPGPPGKEIYHDPVIPARPAVLLLPNFMTAEEFPRLSPRFAEHGLETRLEGDDYDPADIVAILAPPVCPVDGDTMAHLPNLRIIATPSVGQDHIDLAAAAARGISVTTAKGYNSQEVAEYTLAAVLMLAKDIVRSSADVRGRVWEARRTSPLLISECTVGLVGFGEVARRVAVLLTGLGMPVLVWNRSDISRCPESGGVGTVASLEELAARADVISLHVPLAPATRHLIDAALLARMKDGAGLVNTGRGGLVDTAALRDAVSAGRLRGAVLDVLDHEPPRWGEGDSGGKGEPALDCDGILITPHIAWLSAASLHRGFDIAARHIVEVCSAH